MRALIIVILSIVLPTKSYGGCEPDFSGLTETTDLALSYEQCTSGLTISFWKLNKDGSPVKGTDEYFPFDKECEFLKIGVHLKNGDYIKKGFSCRKDGHTPLAGTVFQSTIHGAESKYSENYMEIDAYKCVVGCDNPSVPKYLHKGETSE